MDENREKAKWISDIEANIEVDEYMHHVCSNCRTPAIYEYLYVEDYDYDWDDELYFRGMNCNGIKEHITDFCPECGAAMEKDDAMHEIYGCMACAHYERNNDCSCYNCGDYPFASYELPSKWTLNKNVIISK